VAVAAAAFADCYLTEFRACWDGLSRKVERGELGCFGFKESNVMMRVAGAVDAGVPIPEFIQSGKRGGG